MNIFGKLRKDNFTQKLLLTELESLDSWYKLVMHNILKPNL
ncbi:hypothetical protein FEM21_08580 [Flavobacterium seoulense]|uniref:Uncharacterized protein n=1 Tax=Flavobacterium seoulense TaxID=1492738 RepID=A0A066WYG2_9FLAO|nr:hypothetical protein FEM21_08580 [Flavobacterium seoulense]